MEDFASLVIDVDTTPVNRSTGDLDRLTGAADGAGAAALRLSGNLKLASGAGELIENSIVRANQRLNEMAKQEEAARREAAALAAAQRAAAAEMKRLQDQANAYKAVLDPLAAAQARLAQETQRVQKLVSLQMLTQQEGAQVITRATRVYDETRQRLASLGDTTRVTAGQLTNLRYQAFDAFNMLATGAPISSVIMSQFGGVAQALGDGPGGVGGTLTALGRKAAEIGSRAVSAVGPWNLALIGLTATAYGLYRVFRDEAKPVEDAIKRQERAILALEKAYDVSGAAAERYGRRSKAGLEGTADAETRDNRRTLRANVRDQREDFIGGLGSVFGSSKAMVEFRQQVDDFYESVKNNNPNLDKFDKYLREVQRTAADNGAGRSIRMYADEWLRFNETIQPLIGNLERTAKALTANELAAQRATEKIAELQKQMGQYLPQAVSPEQDIERIYQERMARLSEQRGMSPRAVEGSADRFKRERDDALREVNRQSLEDLMEVEARRLEISKSATEQQVGEINRRYDRQLDALRRQKAGEQRIRNTEAARDEEIRTVREQADRTEKLRRDSYELDVRAINARTAAQKADIAAERAALEARQQNLGDSVAAERAAEARRLTLASSEENLRRSGEELTRTTNRRLDQMQLEQQLTGASVGEAARLRAEFELLAQAKDAARAQGFNDANVELTEEMKEQARAIGDATAAMEKLNFERDVSFRLAQTGRSDVDQRIAAELRSQGIEFESTEGRKRAAILRTVEAAERSAEAMREVRDAGKEAFQDLISSLGTTNSLIENVAGAFSGLGRQLSSAGFDRLFGGLLSGSSTSGSRSSIPSVSVGGPRTTAHVETVSTSSSYPYSDKYALPVARSATQAVTSAGGELAQAIRQSAKTLGVSANDIATVISYETGGTFDSWKKGPTTKWGQHIGYIQMGGPQREKYGYTQDSSITDKMQSVTQYLLDAGVKAGHGLLEIYSAINTGGIGEKYYRRSDAAAGGAPGNVYDKVASMGGHQAKASALLGDEREAKRVIAEGTAQGSRIGVRAAAKDASNSGGARQERGGLGQAFDVLGAGLGIFGAGYESGSPLGGGLQGAMGGFEVGSSLSFLGAAGGPIGAGVGAVVGILGGVLGARKKREEAHRQAAAQWEQMLPQYREYQNRMKDGVGPNSGLRSAFAADDQALMDFMSVGGKAWKYGTGNSSAEFWQTGLNRYSYQDRTRAAFRDSFGAAESGLSAGQGLEGPWIKARDAVRQAAQSMLTFVDDTKVSFGEGAAEVQRAREAGVSQLRSVLRGAEQLSSVQSGILTLEGGAAALRTELGKLGVATEDVARIVGEDLAVGMGKMRSDFEKSIADQVAELDGKSYLSKVRELVETFRTTQEDAARLGADTSLLPTLFQKQAQAIVDGADLSADGLAELVKVFPQLSGVVRTSTSTLSNAVTSAENALRAAYERERSELEATQSRLASFADSLAEFRAGLKLNSGLSTLSPLERLTEAQREFRETAEKARSGDEKSQEKLVDLGQKYLEEQKSYSASSEAYYATFSEVNTTLASVEESARTQIKAADTQLGLLNSQVGKLIDIDTSVKTVTEAIAALNTAQAARDAAQSISMQQYIQALNPTVNLPAAVQPTPTSAVVSTPAPAPAASAPAMEYRNGLAGRNFTFNGATVWLKQGGTFEEAFNAWSQEYGYYNAGIAPHFMTAWKQAGFSGGGYTGPGSVNQPAGIVHRGEVVWSQSDIARWGGVGRVEAMRTAPIPTAVPRSPQNDNREIASALVALGALMGRAATSDDIMKLAEVLVSSDDRTRGTIENSSEASQRRSESSDRLAARRASVKT